jgi:hypothetical protein
MEKGSTIERTSGVRWASKNQGVGKKFSAKAQCAQAKQSRGSEKNGINKIK